MVHCVVPSTAGEEGGDGGGTCKGSRDTSNCLCVLACAKLEMHVVICRVVGVCLSVCLSI